MSDLLNAIVADLQAEERRDGRYYADCPFCGKPTLPHQKHFSFDVRGCKCWVCDRGCGLRELADHLEIKGATTTAYAAPTREPAKPRQWQANPVRYIDDYCGALDRVTRWQSYKPLDLDSIGRFRLGVGRLPSSRSQHRRLIVPVFSKGVCIAFHGRAYADDDTDAKWLTAGGSRKDVLFNGDLLTPGADVIIAENLIDCILAMQVEPSVIAVAGGGVSWRDELYAQIIASKPRSVLVWLDNDAVGNPNQDTHRFALDAWRQEMDARKAAGRIKVLPTPPEPQGPKIANALLSAGVKTELYHWPAGTPWKHDLGSALIKEMQTTRAVC